MFFLMPLNANVTSLNEHDFMQTLVFSFATHCCASMLMGECAVVSVSTQGARVYVCV